MAYTWTNELATGNATIDTQHKQLVTAINDLLDACLSGQGRSKLNTILDFLIDYAAKHFRDEEKIQQQYNYPDFANHKKIHEAFKADVAMLAKQFYSEGPTVSLVGKVNSFLGAWLVNHIKYEDLKIGRHIRSVSG